MISKNSVLATASLIAANAATAFVLPNSKPSFTLPTSPSRLNAAAPGWKGNFKDSDPNFSYDVSKPDLSSLDITGNLDNMKKITRMQKIYWPQFSWQAVPGDESTRLYDLFAKDISRLGYDDEGRIWSLICPQRGMELPILGTAMLEVTVTGVRGWVDEDTRSVCADIGVLGCLWIEPNNNMFAKLFGGLLNKYEFPFSKAKAAKVRGHAVGKPYEEFWQMTNGTDPAFFHPVSMQHWDEAYSVYNLQVEIGKQKMTEIPIVDDFNTLIINAFNIASGNILAEGQKVAWNVWANEPELVDTEEWEGHADKWFHSITVDHTYPTGSYNDQPQYFDGRLFEPLENGSGIEAILGDLKMFFAKYHTTLKEELDHDHSLIGVAGFLKDHLFEKKRKHIKHD